MTNLFHRIARVFIIRGPALGAIALCVFACAGEQSARRSSSQPARSAPGPSPSGVEAQAQAAKPKICDAGNTESEVAEEILARSGRGLLWLVVPDRSEPDAMTVVKRGADEVRAARTLAECLLRHHDADFDATHSQGHAAFEAWVDTHLGPEHAQTLLSAGAAYFASLLVADSWIDAAFDVPAARLLLERATAAAPQLADGLGPLILGAYECFVPKAMGGQAEVGLRRLEEAASHRGGLALAMKVAAAELCAFSLQDRALFDRLLDEVDASKEASSAFDLLAKQRAKTLRDEVEDLFPDQS